MMHTKMIVGLLVTLLCLAACTGATSEPPADAASLADTVASLPEGDATRGETIHNEGSNGAANCASCHSLDGSTVLGPSFQGYSDIAATRIEGLSAAQYTYQAIVNPSVHIVEGYSNVMPGNYGTRLSEQDLADLMAFLLTQ